jgi:hypothetical protein
MTTKGITDRIRMQALDTNKVTRKETCLGQTELRVIVQWPACTWQHNVKEDFTEIKEQKT